MAKKRSDGYDYTKLPEPDKGGAFWFGEPGERRVATIYPFVANKLRAERCQFFLTLPDGTVVTEGPSLKAFDSPEDAFKYLKRWLFEENELATKQFEEFQAKHKGK